MAPAAPHDYDAQLAHLEWLADLLDTRWRIPGLGIRLERYVLQAEGGQSIENPREVRATQIELPDFDSRSRRRNAPMRASPTTPTRSTSPFVRTTPTPIGLSVC